LKEGDTRNNKIERPVPKGEAKSAAMQADEPNVGQASRLVLKMQNKAKILHFQFKNKDCLKNKANYLVNPVKTMKKQNEPKHGWHLQATLEGGFYKTKPNLTYT
jgi:hypothetical protein